jgi:5-methylcytosine-specific restriction endonuclease McrA
MVAFGGMARGYINMEIIGREAAKAAGLTKYFTGKTCKHGHIGPRRVDSCICIQCQNRHSREWKHKNTDKQKELIRKKNWQQNNRDKIKKYRQNNPGKIKAFNHVRRARKLQVGGRHTAEDIANLLKNQDGLCVCCKTDIRENYTVDHIIPISDTTHSSNASWNLQLLCGSCNSSKQDEDPRTWAARHGLTLSVDVLAALA